MTALSQWNLEENTYDNDDLMHCKKENLRERKTYYQLGKYIFMFVKHNSIVQFPTKKDIEDDCQFSKISF